MEETKSKNNLKLLFISLILLTSGLLLAYFSIKTYPKIQSNIPETVETVIETATQASQSGTLGVGGERVLVTRVIDGDTIEIATGEKVRYLGIDTPETLDPRRPVGCFGVEASNQNKQLVNGKYIVMEKDISNADKYNRLLRYIYLPTGDGSFLFVNDYLVREGYAKASTYPPDIKYNENLREAESDARNNNRGLWGACNP